MEYNSKGFSLVQLLVSASILGIIALAAGSLSKYRSSGSKSLKSSDALIVARSSIIQYLSVPDFCGSLLSDMNLSGTTTRTSITETNDSLFELMGFNTETSSLEIKEVELFRGNLSSVTSDTEHYREINFKIKRKSKGGEENLFLENLPIIVVLESETNLLKCHYEASTVVESQKTLCAEFDGEYNQYKCLFGQSKVTFEKYLCEIEKMVIQYEYQGSPAVCQDGNCSGTNPVFLKPAIPSRQKRTTYCSVIQGYQSGNPNSPYFEQ